MDRYDKLILGLHKEDLRDARVKFSYFFLLGVIMLTSLFLIGYKLWHGILDMDYLEVFAIVFSNTFSGGIFFVFTYWSWQKIEKSVNAIKYMEEVNKF